MQINGNVLISITLISISLRLTVTTESRMSPVLLLPCAWIFAITYLVTPWSFLVGFMIQKIIPWMEQKFPSYLAPGGVVPSVNFAKVWLEGNISCMQQMNQTMVISSLHSSPQILIANRKCHIKWSLHRKFGMRTHAADFKNLTLKVCRFQPARAQNKQSPRYEK